MTDAVAAAVRLLVAGVDTPNLRVLAGEDHADPDEALRWLDSTLHDLGLTPLARREATLMIAASLAHDGLADEQSAKAVAPALWRLFADERTIEPWPDAFVRLAFAADGVEDLPWWEDSVPAFNEAARLFLSSRERGK